MKLHASLPDSAEDGINIWVPFILGPQQENILCLTLMIMPVSMFEFVLLYGLCVGEFVLKRTSVCVQVQKHNLVKKVCVYLTQLVEVCVDAVRSWNRADQSGFDEGAPFVHKYSLASNIILAEKTEIQYTQSIKTQLGINFQIHSFIVLALHSSTLDLGSNNLIKTGLRVFEVGETQGIKVKDKAVQCDEVQRKTT